MGRITKLALIVALALASTPVVAQGPEPQPAAPTDAPQAASGLDTLVDGVARALQHEHGIPGLTVSVVQGDALVLARGYGLADIEGERPVLPEETLFRIGSVSKTFTWTAVMMLAERGTLDLDADVNLYLRAVRVADAFDGPVTLRHLMHHRGGFEDTLRVFTVRDDDPRSLPELLAEHQPDRVFPPGARTSYSNWGAALAAQVVEDASGIPYGDFLQTEILDPLGMADTTWTPPAAMEPALAARLATGYRPARGGMERGDYLQLGAYWPAGGIASTATDMARWMRFHLNGGALDGTRLMAPETHAAMWTRAYDDRPAAADVAHGFQDRIYRGLRTFAHGGGTATFLTNMVLVPELGLGVFLSQNSAHAYEPIVQVPNRIVDHLAGHGYQAALADEGATEPLGDFAGTYLGNRRVFTTFAKIVGATSIATVTPVSAETVALAALGEATLFRRLPDAPDTFENASGGRIAFLRDGDGRVVALADEQGIATYERVGTFGSPLAVVAAHGAATLLAITTLLGAWKRRGTPRDVPSAPGWRPAALAAVPLVAALAVLWLVGSIVLLVLDLADFHLAGLQQEPWPSPLMLHMHAAGLAVAGAALALLVALVPVWRGSGWRTWRRAHATLFAVSIAILAVLLWHWRVIGAPVV